MSSKFSILLAHDDEKVLSQWESSLKSLSANLEVYKTHSVTETYDEMCAQTHDLLMVDYSRQDCDGKRILNLLEDIPAQEWPRLVVAVADMIDRGFMNIDVPNLSYLRRNFNPHEFQALLSGALGLKPKTSLDAVFIMPFIQGTLDVLKTMASVEASKESVSFSPNAGDFKISGVIPLSSQNFYGSMAISFEEGTFLGVVSRMLGEEYSEITDELKDAASEICNQVFGFAKSKLNEKGHTLQMAIPQVVMGSPIPHGVRGQYITVKFKTDLGSFYIETVVQ